jgi:hypothetical protein
MLETKRNPMERSLSWEGDSCAAALETLSYALWIPLDPIPR